MRKYILIALVLVAAGVGLSLTLLPTQEEVATAQQRDVAQISAAADLGNVDIEAEYAAGRRTFPIINALADKRVNEGNRPAAVALLEEYVTANPNDMSGRKKLAEQYQLSENTEKYYQQVEFIAAGEPNEENLKTLSYVYSAGGLYDKQIDTLKKLVDVTQSNNPSYMGDLATLLVSQNRMDEALALIAQIKAKHPTYRSYTIARVEISALANSQKGEESYQLAERWMQGYSVAQPIEGTTGSTTATGNLVATSTKELADLANILHYGGFAELALKLIEPRVNLIATDAELATAYVNANITAGNSDRAYEVLTSIYASGSMPAALYRPYIDLALQREDHATAESVAASIKPEIFSQEEALVLMDTPSLVNAPAVYKSIVQAFNQPTYLADKPVLAAVVAMGSNTGDQDQKIADALKAQLTSSMRVRLAKACYRADKSVCLDEVVKGFPALASMTKPQIDEYADLHIAVRRAEQIEGAVAAEVAKRPELGYIHAKLAAASGRDDVIATWLVNHGATSTVTSLQALYYTAADAGKQSTASLIAVKLYERDPSPMNRELLVASLLQSGDYDKALPLVRDNLGKTAGASGQYLTVLSKLARSNAEARKELNDYSLSVLTTGEDNRAQLSAAYSLINNGQRDAAMPYIKSFAESRGGEWAIMWRQLNSATAKPGAAAAPVKLSADQMLRIARDAGSSEATKRQMAFNLLNEGRRADAISIFEQLAANKGPDNQNVKDLLYLWGPKLSGQQLAWLNSRASSATNSYEKAKWYSYINSYADDAAVVDFVSRTPDALYNADMRKKYFRSLASMGSRDAYDTNMRNWVAGTSDIEALRDYADTGLAYGFRDAAQTAYKRIEQLNPSDEKALSALSSINFAKGSYKASEDYVNRLSSVQASKAAPETNVQETAFYKAQLLRRQGKDAEAQQAFQQVVATSNESTLGLAGKSRLYTSYFHLGDHARGKQGFRSLLAQYPDDKNLLADFMSILIEYKYVDEASAIANQYDKTSPYYGRQSMRVNSPAIAQASTLSNGREVLVRFSQPIEGKAPISSQHAAWVESARAGYDSMVISAKPGYVLKFMPTSETSMEVVPVAASTQALSPQEELQREQDLRLQLLYAQIEQQNGQHDAANKRLEILSQYYPNNPQILAAQAGTMSAMGNRNEAIRLLETAQGVAPENEAISQILTNVRDSSPAGFASGYTNYVRLDHEFRSFGAWNEQISTLSSQVRVAPNLDAGIVMMNDALNPKTVIDPSSGNVLRDHTSRQAAELYLAHTLGDGSRLQGSLYSSGAWLEDGYYSDEQNFGAGVTYAFDNVLGRTEAIAEYHRPFWDFPEAVYAYTTRDRVGARHFATINPRLNLGVETSLNRYNVEIDEGNDPVVGGIPLNRGLDGDGVTNSALFRLSAIYGLQEQTATQPYLGVGYGFDGEYMLGDVDDRQGLTSRYLPLPFRSREIHMLNGIYRDDWTDSTHVLLTAGYIADRLNDAHGPVAEARVTQDIDDHWEVGARARYGLLANSGNFSADESAIVGGAHLMYKF